MLRSKPNGDVKQMLTQTFEQGDKTLMVHLEKLGKEVLSNAGSTGTVVVVQHNGTVGPAEWLRLLRHCDLTMLRSFCCTMCF